MALEIVRNVVVYGVLVLLCGVMCTYLPILLRFQIVIGMYVSEMTTITLQMMAITITISAKIMMVITIIHRSLYQYMQYFLGTEYFFKLMLEI